MRRGTITATLMLLLTLSLVQAINLSDKVSTTGEVIAQEQTQQELKQTLKTRLEEKKEQYVDQAQRLQEEKKALEAKGGHQVIVAYVNNSGRFLKLTITEIIKDNKIQRTMTYISPEGQEETITSDININDYQKEGNLSRLRAQKTDGTEQDLELLPEQASAIAEKNLNTKNFTMSLKETIHNNIPRIVYHIETHKQGRFLGIIRMNVPLSLEVDSEQGTTEKNKPWWAILVIGEDNQEQDHD